MSEVSRNTKLNWGEIAAATLLLLLGLYMVVQGLGYSIGTPRQMGPGFFPVMVGVALALLALGVIVEVRFSRAPLPDLPFKPLAGIAAGLAVFALTVDSLGLIPSSYFLILLSLAGDSTVSWKQALAIATAVAVMGYLVFGLVFRLSLSPFWW